MRFTGFFIALACVFCLPLSSNAANANKIVAVINGTNLFEADLNQEINILMPMNQSFHGKLSDEKMAKIRSEALKNLVDSELKAQDARVSGVKIPKVEIDEELKNIAKKFNSKDGLSKAYINAGFTDESFVLALERRLLAEKVRLLRVDDKISVSPTSVKTYYDNNVSRYNKPEEFRSSVILLKVDPSSTSEERAVVRAKAETLLKKIADGAKFDEVAANESDDLSRIKGGDLGFFHAGQLLAEFENALVKLKVGENSPIVETLQGYLIIKLTDKRPPRQIPFAEIQDKIRKDLVESEKKQLLEDWMARLFKKAVIAYPGESNR